MGTVFDVNSSRRLTINLATAGDILTWSNGEVKKPETINYRTLKPEKDGLFCEKIFGPTKDWECYCGKYKRVRFKGIICERCGVEVTRSKVRRERMGHIELAAPVTHIWYFKGVPSRLGYLLDIAPKSLEKVIYFAAHLITWVDTERLHKDLPKLEADVRAEIDEIRNEAELRIRSRDEEYIKELEDLEGRGAKRNELERAEKARNKDFEDIRSRSDLTVENLRLVWDTFRALKPKQLVDDERVWRELQDRFQEYFAGGMGAEAVKDLVSRLDLQEEEVSLKEVIATAKGQRKAKAIKRLKVISAFNRRNEDGRAINSPMGMILDAIPVIPPDLRPMVQLDGGRFATSDLNDLYRRVINRNNRLKRLLDLGAPEIIINNEKRMLQEAVDALFDNGRRGRPVTGPGNRPLKSLSDMLKGKQGRFRQNLLGKRVDYSGRSVIVSGPRLKLHQCGLPKLMALELFKPFIMSRLVERKSVQNIKAAKKYVDSMTEEVWDVLEEVIAEHPVLLNRAPTLHRLGIQAFEPKLVEGKAIQVHPLVCHAFNADFDGDQMAVHLPLSAEAQAEARILMLSSNNILSPASGRPLATPTQDMVLGAYYLTYSDQDLAAADAEKMDPRPRRFDSADEIEVALEMKAVGLQEPIEFRFNGELHLTTAGRVLINSAVYRALDELLPPDEELDFDFMNQTLAKPDTDRYVLSLSDRYGAHTLAPVLDTIKTLGFRYATKAGVTISKNDIIIPPDKEKILGGFEERVEEVHSQYDMGLITEDERHETIVNIWTEATDEVASAMEENFDELNPVFMMANSGARGSFKQIRQLAGMRGLMANPKGEIIERPIKANFMEGLTVLEYFISTHGARKGLADTALRTADSGYLTRRLVDVAQDVIIREPDCGTEDHIELPVFKDGGEPNDGLVGRVAALPITTKRSRMLAEKGAEIGRAELADMAEAFADDHEKGNATAVPVRSVLKCEAQSGVCQACYGRAMATGALAQIGDAVGIIAAQSIGEPGTQLTMRTFHTGGVAGADITHGLPRVVELFEARRPKGLAKIAEQDGVVSIEETDKALTVVITDDSGEEHRHT